MRYKKIMILTIILTFLLVVSAVSAVENATDDIVGADASDDVVSVEETTDEVVSVENDNQVITVGNDSDVGSFADLEAEINNVEEGGVLNLTRDYKYINGSIEGIYISKAITIDGKGHALDGNGLSRIFFVSVNNVVLKNVNFVNAKNEEGYGHGGAINWQGNNGKLINSTFENNSAYGFAGGSIYWYGKEGFISNCSFKKNFAISGGDVYWQGKDGILVNCSFMNSSATSGDAVYWDGINGFLSSCNFVDSSNSNSGSAVVWAGFKGVLANCSFVNSFSVQCDGGAVYWNGDNGVLANCSFVNSTSFYKYVGGGAVSWRGLNGVLANCSFMNSYAKNVGGAINLDGDGTVLINCSFVNSYSNNFGGAVYWRSENGVLANCSFYNNSAKEGGNAIYWYGENGLINKSYFSQNFNSIYSGVSDLKIIKFNSLLSCENISFEFKDDENLSANLNTYGELIFNVFNKKYGNKVFIINTTNNGSAKLCGKLNNLEVGQWNVTVIFEGNDNYAPCNATATITVLPLSSSVTVDDINASWDQETTFTAHVTSNNTPVNEGTVSFYIDDEFIGNSSVIDGVANLSCQSLGVLGEHIIMAIYNGDNYLSSNSTSKLFVEIKDKNISDYSSVGTFKELSNLIENTPEGDTLNLTKDYIWVSGSTEGIIINKSIIIDGQGHTLEGNMISRAFNISADNVSLKNMKFIDSTAINSPSNERGWIEYCGGAVYIKNCDNVEILNCTFSNNIILDVYGIGADIFFGNSSNCSILNCNFVNSSSYTASSIFFESINCFNIENCKFLGNIKEYGTACGGAFGASNSNHGNIVGCIFENHIVNTYGGAMDLYKNNNISILNSIFINELSENIAGSIYIRESNVNVINCSFLNCSSTNNGGVFYLSESFINISDSKFTNNKANSGGSIFIELCGVKIENCNFMNNSAYSGGSITINGHDKWTDTYCDILIENSIFMDNYASNGGAISSWFSNSTILTCVFINNTANCGNSIYYDLGSKSLLNHSYFNPSHDSIYDSAEELIIIKQDTQFIGDVVGSFYSSAEGISELPIFLKDLKNNSLGNQNLTLIINQGTINLNAFTNDEGMIILVNTLQLQPSSWDVNIIFDGDDNYASSNLNTILNFIPADSKISINDLNTTVNHEVILVANVSSNSSLVNEGIVTFFDGQTQIGESNVYDGVATLTYTPTTAGEHAITAIFNSTNYLSSNSTAKLLVDSATVDVLVEQGGVGFNSTFVAEVKGLYSTINEGTVTFYINDEYLGSVPVVNGSASISYVPLNADTYTVKAVFGDSDKFLSDEDSVSYVVVQADSDVIINDMNGTVGHDITITVNLVSSNNLTINEGYVIFFDGQTQIGESNVYDGVATLTYTPTTAGEHAITAMFYSTNYGDPINSALLNVSKAEIDLSIDYIADVYFTNPSNFAVNVLSNSKGVNEGIIEYYVNGMYVGMSYVYDGKASTSFTTNTTGFFELLVIYNETDNYFAKNASTTFYVNQMPTTLTGESIIFDEQQYKTFTTELKDNNANGVYNQTVRIELIKYSGESATFTGVSDGDGITFYDVGTLAGGMWYVAGTYSGNENYIGSNFADKFIVVRLDTTTEIEEIQNAQVNHNYKLKANIHDENGKLVKEGILQFYLDGVDIGSIDLSQNQGHQSALGDGLLGAVNPMFEYELGADASDLYLNYIPTKAGKHTLTAVYEGTTVYKSSNSTTSFVVSSSSKKETSITASSVTTVYNGGKYLTITVKDVFGKAVSGVKVTVKFANAKTVTSAATNKNGQVKVSTNGLAPVKTYKATITFAGNAKYDKATKTVNVKVTKATPKLTAKAKTLKRSDKTKKYTVTLKTNQNKVMKSTTVKITVNKKTYTAKTNSKGVATFKLTKLTKKGKYTAVVKYAGSNNFNAKTVKVKITVK